MSQVLAGNKEVTPWEVQLVFQNMNLTDLDLTGNPVVNSSKFMKALTAVLPSTTLHTNESSECK